MIIFAEGFGLYSNKNYRRMIKKVFLLRHAQTAGKQAGQQDYDRELTPEGVRQVNSLGHLMVMGSLIPEFILSSSSRRTRSTTLLLSEALQIPPSQIRYLDSLYEATTTEWIRQLRQFPDSVSCLLLVGHNPAVSHLASILGNRSIDLPAGGFIVYEFSSLTWADFPKIGVEVSKILNAHG